MRDAALKCTPQGAAPPFDPLFDGVISPLFLLFALFHAALLLTSLCSFLCHVVTFIFAGDFHSYTLLSPVLYPIFLARSLILTLLSLI